MWAGERATSRRDAAAARERRTLGASRGLGVQDPDGVARIGRTLEWESTTLVLVEVEAGGSVGIGYTYADPSTAVLIRDRLAELVRGRNALNVAGAWLEMVASARNLGRPGLASMAIAALDVALWDLKARLLELPLVSLLGAVQDRMPVYGSGGFTSDSGEQLRRRCRRWVEQGIPRVKSTASTSSTSGACWRPVRSTC